MNIQQLLFRLLLGKRLPTFEGELVVPGMQSEIQIQRDEYGVPYIEAKNELDAWYGLGFCQGQDRSFQLETFKRLANGTLAEILGKQALPLDRLSRRIGYRRAAEDTMTVIPEDQKEALSAFVRGVNAGRTVGNKKLPHEFVLLRTAPTEWDETDVLAYMHVIGMTLSTWSSKLTRLFVLKHDGPDALDALDSEYPEWMLVSNPVQGLAGTAVRRLLQDTEALLSYFGTGASNNWALNSTRTKSGNPILANDPHLSPRLPAPWYLAHIRCPDLRVCGASFIGVPLIPSGFNGTAAWGITAGLVDNIDLFVEKIDQQNQQVLNGDSFENCEVVQEKFLIKGEEDPFEDEIYITPRGPIITDVMDEFDELLSMKATWMIPRPVTGIKYFHHVTNFETCRENFKNLLIVSLNVAYADTSNAIGWQLIGDAPKRTVGNGLIPMPGWNTDYDWGRNLIPRDEMPWLQDPECGYLATANNQPLPHHAGPYLGRDWFPYRHVRIVECLEERHDWDLKNTLGLQLDLFAIPWREMREIVLSVPCEDQHAQQAQSMLSKWNGIVAADSAAAAIYEYFVISIAQRMARVKAPASTDRVLGRGFSAMFSETMFYVQHVSLVVSALRDKPDNWFEKGWDFEIASALSEAFSKLCLDLGDEPEKWGWGNAHQLVMSHSFGSRRPFDRIFNRGPYPLGGDHQTVAQAGRSVRKFNSRVSGIPNLRMAVEVGKWDQNYFILAGGQSGNPLSPNYDDQLQRWLRGETIEIAWTDEAISKKTKQTLKLKPEK